MRVPPQIQTFVASRPDSACQSRLFTRMAAHIHIHRQHKRASHTLPAWIAVLSYSLSARALRGVAFIHTHASLAAGETAIHRSMIRPDLRTGHITPCTLAKSPAVRTHKNARPCIFVHTRTRALLRVRKGVRARTRTLHPRPPTVQPPARTVRTEVPRPVR